MPPPTHPTPMTTPPNAPALVLLPGMDGTGDLFAPFLAELAGTAEATVISYPPDQPMDYVQLEQFVRQHLPV